MSDTGYVTGATTQGTDNPAQGLVGGSGLTGTIGTTSILGYAGWNGLQAISNLSLAPGWVGTGLAAYRAEMWNTGRDADGRRR